jgi:hypothetical protein
MGVLSFFIGHMLKTTSHILICVLLAGAFIMPFAIAASNASALKLCWEAKLSQLSGDRASPPERPIYPVAALNFSPDDNYIALLTLNDPGLESQAVAAIAKRE